jgi:hypothetical protein
MSTVIIVSFGNSDKINKHRVFTNIDKAAKYAWERITPQQQQEAKSCFAELVEMPSWIEKKWAEISFSGDTQVITFSAQGIDSDTMYQRIKDKDEHTT